MAVPFVRISIHEMSKTVKRRSPFQGTTNCCDAPHCVYSRNNQHCLCAPLHIQVYNAVYTACAVYTFLTCAASNDTFPPERKFTRCNNGTLLIGRNRTCGIDCNRYVPFGINWLMERTRSGTSISCLFYEKVLPLPLQKIFNVIIIIHWSNSVSSYCITKQSISLTRRDNGQWSNNNVDFFSLTLYDC